MATNASAPILNSDPFEGIPIADLEKSLLKPRNLTGGILSGLMFIFTVIAILPLFSVLIAVIVRGGAEISYALFTELPPVAFEEGGGIGNAIVGTLFMVALAALISVPIGVLAGIFLAEVGPGSKLAHLVRFSAKVLTGFPSILAGVFTYGAVVITTGTNSALAGSIALSILMIPMILLTAEESIRMVPSRMREAAIGMGCNQFQVVKSVLLPTAFPGILTGIMLAVARAAGETAPLLLTALFNNDWINASGRIEVMQPTASLAVLIYNFAQVPYENQIRMAWAAALVLVVVVLITNLIAQSLSPKQVRR